MFDEIFDSVKSLMGYASSSQRVFAYKDDVIDLANVDYAEGVDRIQSLMAEMGSLDRQSFANLIKFMAGELSRSGHWMPAAKLMELHPVAEELAGR